MNEIDEILEQGASDAYQLEIQLQQEELVTDGGTDRRYIWIGQDGIFTGIDQNGDYKSRGVYQTTKAAERELEQVANQEGWDEFSDMVLYELRTGKRYKVMEATEVQTSQVGLTDF